MIASNVWSAKTDIGQDELAAIANEHGYMLMKMVWPPKFCWPSGNMYYVVKYGSNELSGALMSGDGHFPLTNDEDHGELGDFLDGLAEWRATYADRTNIMFGELVGS